MWETPRQHAIVGKCLQEERERANLTQVVLAKRLGKAQSFVSSYESGQRRIDLLEFLLIAEALQADPSKVFADIVQAKGRARPQKGTRKRS